MKKKLSLFAICFVFFQVSLGATCLPQFRSEDDRLALQAIAKQMSIPFESFCADSRVERVLDFYFTDKVLFNEKFEPELHTWVSFHYDEYSCQYFVRKADSVITKQNCYNTW